LTSGILSHSSESINVPLLSIHMFGSVSAPTWCGTGQKPQYIRSAFSSFDKKGIFTAETIKISQEVSNQSVHFQQLRILMTWA